MLTDNQKAVLSLIEENGRLTTAKIVETLGRKYFNNGAKYVGEILTRMVRGGHVKRVRTGVYEKGTGNKTVEANPGQFDLFIEPGEFHLEQVSKILKQK